LVLVGTGTAGAYHAGVLRALREAGVRVDVVAGRGMGAVSAMFAAVDADARLWEAEGVWLSPAGPPTLYAWRRTWQVVAGGVALAVAGMALPLAAALGLAAVYPLVYLLHLAVPAVGAAVSARYAEAVAWLLSPALLVGILPRVVAAGVLLVLVALAGCVAVGGWRQRPGRRARGRAWWWQALGAPLDASAAAAWAAASFWDYLRGAASVAQPRTADLGQRYAELLRENVGQPGYRELLIAVHDLDARADVVFALLNERDRQPFFRPAGPRSEDRALDTVDLAARGVHVFDALAAALSLAPATEPHLVRFGPDGPWRGECHRMTDRAAATSRLLEELLPCGVRQVILVSPDQRTRGPHALASRPLDPRLRFGEALRSEETAAIRDAPVAFAARFEGFFVIRPAHNPVGPFDFAGAPDEQSDRVVTIRELVARGYEDAHRQFIEPIVGASGDTLAAQAGAWDPGSLSLSGGRDEARGARSDQR
jgi:hypothetical protein